MRVPGFYWLYDNLLAGSGLPGWRPRQGSIHTQSQLQEDELETDLRWLGERNVRGIITLTEDPLPPDALRSFGFHTLHLPVPDLTAPPPQYLIMALEFIDQRHASGHATLVHCLMGQGRTGTVLAAYLTRGGLPPELAIQRIRQVCPGAIGTPEQERAIHAFARRRDWIV